MRPESVDAPSGHRFDLVGLLKLRMPTRCGQQGRREIGRFNSLAGYPPRVVELLRKAIEWQALLESGEASNQAAIARREGFTRARVTQVMGLLRLAPEIQDQILSLPEMVRRPAITERALRPITQLKQRGAQVRAFEQLVDQH